MLSIFKSKPKLAELIPSGYVDIHSHVLPGIDDGAQKIKDAEFLLESMIDFWVFVRVAKLEIIELTSSRALKLVTFLDFSRIVLASVAHSACGFLIEERRSSNS